MSFKNAIAVRSTADKTPATIMENQIGGGFYCSLDMSTEKGKKEVFNATASPEKLVKECVNIPINMRGLYIEPVELVKKDENGNPVYTTNENGEPILDETGEPIVKTDICPRMIIFDDKGVSYTCCSFGAYAAMKRIINLFGTPDTWEKPVTIVPIVQSKGKNQILSFKLG